uniref:Ig-like domain-containing protein n=1 Tax=Cyprinus carpio TaxID=7962 RepID=A0A8C1Z0D7_CYPCA
FTMKQCHTQRARVSVSGLDVLSTVKADPAIHKANKLVLICLATGFYPRDIEMNIRLNRINIERSYDCHVIHSSLTEPVSVEWGKYHHK